MSASNLQHLNKIIQDAIFNLYRRSLPSSVDCKTVNLKDLASTLLAENQDQETNSTSNLLESNSTEADRDQNPTDSSQKYEKTSDVNTLAASIIQSGVKDLSIKEVIKQVEYSFPTPIIFNELIDKYLYYLVHKEKKYNWGVLGFEVDKFFSYGAYFCKYEAVEKKLEIVSVGFDIGTVEDEITKIYPGHFGNELDIPNKSIILVDLGPESQTEFKTVDDLLAKRPDLVGNCVLFLMWPEPEFENNNNYDIEAICKLQPRSLLTLYETTGLSGSAAFRALLDNKENPELNVYKEKNPGLNNYTVEKVAHQDVNYGIEDKKKLLIEENKSLRPEICVFKLRVGQMKKLDQ